MDGQQLVRVLVRGVQGHTVCAYGLLVFDAVEHQRLAVHLTGVLEGGRLRQCRVGEPDVRLARVLEREVGDFLAGLQLRPAYRARLVELPAVLQTLPAETVRAGQQHRVAEDVVAHGAGELLAQSGTFHRVHIHAFSHDAQFAWSLVSFWRITPESRDPMATVYFRRDRQESSKSGPKVTAETEHDWTTAVEVQDGEKYRPRIAGFFVSVFFRQ